MARIIFKVLCLLFFHRAEIHLADLGESVNYLRHLSAESCLNLFYCDEAVLDGVMEEGSDYGRSVKMHLAGQKGHFKGMIEVWFAR